MDRELDALGMLDLMANPCFCVKENRIIGCNPAAEAMMLTPGMDISQLLGRGQEDEAKKVSAFSLGHIVFKVI